MSVVMSSPASRPISNSSSSSSSRPQLSGSHSPSYHASQTSSPLQRAHPPLPAPTSVTRSNATSPRSPRGSPRLKRPLPTDGKPAVDKPAVALSPRARKEPSSTRSSRDLSDMNKLGLVSASSSPRFRHSPRQSPRDPAVVVAARSKPHTPPTAAGRRSELKTEVDQPPVTSPTKRAKPPANAKKIVPPEYNLCSMGDLVVMISDMLNELVNMNDGIPLSQNGLTRFHSRAPPTISIVDYLHRIAHHTTLEPSTILSMIYYIDLLSNNYPAFTISSLTVHRFLITAATVASKGLCDSFCTNTFYAKVGGISLRELNVLELEFVARVDWKIVPKFEVLTEYYESLVKRMGDGWEIVKPAEREVEMVSPIVAEGSVENRPTMAAPTTGESEGRMEDSSKSDGEASADPG